MAAVTPGPLMSRLSALFGRAGVCLARVAGIACLFRRTWITGVACLFGRTRIAGVARLLCCTGITGFLRGARRNSAGNDSS